MSTTFHVSGETPNFDADACPACRDGDWQACEDCDGSGFSEAYRAGRPTPPNYVNVGHGNVAELLRWLGYEVDADVATSGILLPGDLRARCMRRLASTPDNVATDLPRAGLSFGGPGTGHCRVIRGERRAGYLADKARELLALAERAGDRVVEYS